eukprot:9259350-Ditylum_brightwellii.AAC.1
MTTASDPHQTGGPSAFSTFSRISLTHKSRLSPSMTWSKQSAILPHFCLQTPSSTSTRHDISQQTKT